MTAQEILTQWAQFSKYDPEQKKFRIGSMNYEYHRVGEAMSAIMPYDPTGIIAIIYAKTRFEELVKQARFSQVTLYDALTNPEVLDFSAEKAMWETFQSPECVTMETHVLDALNQIVLSAVNQKQIGDRDMDAERKVLAESISTVVSSLAKCHTELYLKGGVIQPFTKFNTYIHVFETLAECLLKLERAEDGIYICYINNHGTADGYFGFFVKNNGNLFSVNERVNEAFPGQHKRSRNGRWEESKKYDMFPYSFLFKFSEHDYLGYAAKHMIDRKDLALFHLAPEGYMPLLLAMLMLNYKYANTNPEDMPHVLVDALLQNNLKQVEAAKEIALVPINDSGLVAQSSGYEVPFTSDDILDKTGEQYYRFTDKNLPYTERGEFLDEGFYTSSDAALFIDLYGQGFHLNTEKLLFHDNRLLLTNGKAADMEDANFEFVGTKNQMDLIAFQQGRAQLTEYIRDKMWEEFITFGGADAVQKWFDETMQEHKDHLFTLCVDFYKALQTGETTTVGTKYFRKNSEAPFGVMDYCEGKAGKPSEDYLGMYWYDVPFNEPTDWRKEKFRCPMTGNIAKQFFFFRPRDYKDLQVLFPKAKLPKVVQGWRYNGHTGVGNSILRVTDPLTGVGTLLEDREIRMNQHARDHKDQVTTIKFAFSIVFSKRGLAMLKNIKEKYS